MKQDSFLKGILIGIIAPLVSYLIHNYTTIQQTFFAQKPIAIFVIAGGINLLLLRMVYKKGWDNTGRGIMFITFLSLLAVLYTHKIFA